MGSGRQMGLDKIKNQMNVHNNNANGEMMQVGNGEIRNSQSNNSQGIKQQDQTQVANSEAVEQIPSNQDSLRQDEHLYLIKESFSKSNSCDPEIQRQIISEVQYIYVKATNTIIKAIRSQDDPFFQLQVNDKKRKDFKDLVLMVCPRKDSPYEIADCKNFWSLEQISNSKNKYFIKHNQIQVDI